LPGVRITLGDTQAQLPGGAGGVQLTAVNQPIAANSVGNGARGYWPDVRPGGAPRATKINGERLTAVANRQVWIKVESVDRQKNEYAGSLASEPDNIEKLKIGSPCQGSFANIRDWMFVENGKLVGGYTERVLYSHYSEKEKEIFKRDSKYRIE